MSSRIAPLLASWKRLFAAIPRDPVDEALKLELLYEGQLIAELTKQEEVDMFWAVYTIEHRSEAAQGILAKDELWEGGRFAFRGKKTGLLCENVLVGGGRPFVREGQVMLRGVFFSLRKEL